MANDGIYNLYTEISGALPTAYRADLQFDQSCCALHEPTKVALGDVGCANWTMGVHKSIKAIHSQGVRYCHTEIGQRVLDGKLFKLVADDKELYSMRGGASKRFLARYAAGYPVGLHVYGAGYCYVGPFLVTVRSRVARCLGPLPLVADVVRFMFAVGDRNMVPMVIEVQKSGALHLERDGVSGFKFDRLLEMLLGRLKIDPFVRVGIDEEGGVSLPFGQEYVVEKVPLSIAICDRVTDSQDFAVAKVYCEVCGCMINPVGHGERCRVRGAAVGLGDAKGVGWSRLRRHAWIGDAVLAFDVRLGCLLMKVEPACLNQEVVLRTSDQQLACWWDELIDVVGRDGLIVSCSPSSVKEKASAFEANYIGRFRSLYLKLVFPSCYVDILGFAVFGGISY